MPACICPESKKPLAERNWKIWSRIIYKHYGPYVGRCDFRRLLQLKCLSCDAYWGNKNPTSPYWAFINETPWSDGKKVTANV